MNRRRKSPTNPSPHFDLHHRVRDYFQTLRIPLSATDLDAALAQAEKERHGPLEFLARLLGPQADLRRQRAIERRIREARFRENVSLEGFDWDFNAQAIDRRQIEALATGEFIRRGDNLVIAGQSGVGKSRIVQSVGRAACALGYHVRYITSAELFRPQPSRTTALLHPLRHPGDRRIRVRPHRAGRVRPGRQLAVQGHRQPRSQAFHRPGD
jgi:hypothetical protein